MHPEAPRLRTGITEIIEGYTMVRKLGEMRETLRRAEARRLDDVNIKHPHPFATGKGILQSNGRFR